MCKLNAQKKSQNLFLDLCILPNSLKFLPKQIITITFDQFLNFLPRKTMVKICFGLSNPKVSMLKKMLHGNVMEMVWPFQ